MTLWRQNFLRDRAIFAFETWKQANSNVFGCLERTG